MRGEEWRGGGEPTNQPTPTSEARAREEKLKNDQHTGQKKAPAGLNIAKAHESDSKNSGRGKVRERMSEAA